MPCLQNNVLLKAGKGVSRRKDGGWSNTWTLHTSPTSSSLVEADRGTGGRFVSSLVGRLDWHQGWLALPLSSGNLALSPPGRETGWQQPRRKYLGVTSHSPRASCALTSGASRKIRGQVSRPESRCVDFDSIPIPGGLSIRGRKAGWSEPRLCGRGPPPSQLCLHQSGRAAAANKDRVRVEHGGAPRTHTPLVPRAEQ